MGAIKFYVPGLADFDEKLASTAHVVGIEGIPWAGEIRSIDNVLGIQRSIDESGRTRVVWPTLTRGPIMLSTASLRCHETPYHLPRELARGCIDTFTTRYSEWTRWGIQPTATISELMDHANRNFVDSVVSADNTPAASIYAQHAIEYELAASRLLCQSYSRQLLTNRLQQEGKMQSLIGARLPFHSSWTDKASMLEPMMNTAWIDASWHNVRQKSGKLDIERLEEHRFEPLKVLQWRNRNLNFHSIDRLLASLNALPNREGLTRARAGADIETLSLLSRDRAIDARTGSPDRVELLWETCQLPDYRNITGAEHAHLVATIFRYLVDAGRIDHQWFARQLSYCDNTNGDIDTLSNRIAHVRTWTFVANRPGWLDNASHWQERTRAMEDKLSDALHERLTQRFIDRRTSVLMKRLREREELMSSVDQEGAVLVEGEVAGHIEGLRFKPDANKGEHSRMLLNAAQKAVSDALAGRAQSLVAAPDPDLTLKETGEIIWLSHPVGRLVATENILKPRVEVLADQQVSGADREAVQLRLSKFVSRHIAGLLEPLVALADDDTITGLARGIAFQLIEATGVLPREQVADQIKDLGQDERASLRKHGVRFGAFHIFIPALLKPAPTSLRLLLWALHDAEKRGLDPALLPQYVPQQGLTSVPFNRETPRGFYQVVGFRHCGERAVRVDMLERLADMIRTRVFWRAQREGEQRPDGSVEGGGFTVVPDMMSLVGCSGDEFASILRSLVFSAQRRKVEPTPAVAAEAPSGEAETPAAEAPAAEAVVPDTEAPAEAVQAVKTDETAATTEAAAEPQFIDVWWPKDTGPFRHQKQAHRQHKASGRPGGGKGKQSGKPRHHGEANKPRRSTGSQPAKPRKEREADPNSPFAILSQLKQDLSRK